MRVLVLGLNPSGKGGMTSHTIKILYGWMDRIGIDRFSFCNIYPKPGKFQLKDIKKEYIREIVPNYDKVLALGVRVSDVLELMGIDHFQLPHPSGLNRQLNDKKLVHNRLTLCKNYLNDAT